MDYQTLIERLSRRGLFRIKPGLERIQAVTRVLGNPQDAFRSIHIAGTNGKGSVAACLESVLRHAGFRTGLYTSPHLWDVRERIQIDCQPITVSKFWETAQKVLDGEKRAGTSLTYFEFLTVMSFVAFADTSIDTAVIETGMGGRWDATNVLARPALTIITSIGLDHVQWLGRTERAIAREKAGIVKAGSPLISGVRGPAAYVIAAAARKRGAPLKQLDIDFSTHILETDWDSSRQTVRYTGLTRSTHTFTVGLLGDFQADNIAVVLAGLETLRRHRWTISTAAIQDGLNAVSWPGRFQRLPRAHGADVIFDGAHNPPALRRLLHSLNHSPWRASPKTFVFGVYRDKDYKRMLNLIRPQAQRILLCSLPGKRALPARKTAKALSNPRTFQVVSDPHQALKTAMETSRRNDLIVVTGSLALVGTLLKDCGAPCLV